MTMERVPTAERCSLDTFVWFGLVPERARKKLFSLLRGSLVRTNPQIAHTYRLLIELVNMLIEAFRPQIQSFNT